MLSRIYKSNNRVDNLNSMERSIDNNARNQEQYSTNGCQQHLEKKLIYCKYSPPNYLNLRLKSSH